jgi:hypothetical protein
MQKILFDVVSLQELCDTTSWERGALLHRRGAAELLEVIEQDGIDYDDEYASKWHIAGAVQGTQRQPYRVVVKLEVSSNEEVELFESTCSCPVGLDCKHGIALTLAAGQNQQTQRVQRPQRAPQGDCQWQDAGALIAHLQQKALQEKETQLLHWLQDLDRANTQARPPAPLQPKERHEQYLYVLSVGEDKPSPPVLRLQTMLSYVKRGGGWAKPKRIPAQLAIGQPAYDRASESERNLLQLMAALPGWRSVHSYYYSSFGGLLCVLPEGSVGQQVLQQAADTGRLLVEVKDDLSATPIQWGEPLALDWAWKETEGHWSLRPKLAQASAKLCLNNPPLYLDAARGLCGPVDAGALSSAQLQVLLRAPALSREAVKNHQAALAQRLGPVPLPPVLDNL